MKKRIRVRGRSSNLDQEKVIHDAGVKEGYRVGRAWGRKELSRAKKGFAKQKVELERQRDALFREKEVIQIELDRAQTEIHRLIALQRPHISRKISDPVEWLHVESFDKPPYKVDFGGLIT